VTTRTKKSKRVPVVAFTSDFGSRDSYVAEVKAQLLDFDPVLLVVDITHQVDSYLPAAGAFHLLRAYRHFPPGTTFLAAVDPGVGGARDALAVSVGHYRFVGPGNGVLRWAVDDAAQRLNATADVRTIAVSAGASPTFHARDVFAPAILDWFRNPKAFAKRTEGQLGGMPFPEPLLHEKAVRGIVIHEDHFGNLVTNIPSNISVTAGIVDDRSVRLERVPTYAAISDGVFGLVAASHGFWEIALRESSASARLQVKLGQGITLAVDASR